MTPAQKGYAEMVARQYVLPLHKINQWMIACNPDICKAPSFHKASLFSFLFG